MGETCGAAVPAGPGVLIVCGMPAAAVHDYGCVCGHVRRGASCTVHAPRPGIVGCAECWQSGHDCRMTAMEVRTGA